VEAGPVDDLLHLSLVGGVGGHEKQPIRALAVADSHEACRVLVGSHDAASGREQLEGKGAATVGPGFEDQNDGAVVEHRYR
jgi:hypothetical protein